MGVIFTANANDSWSHSLTYSWDFELSSDGIFSPDITGSSNTVNYTYNNTGYYTTVVIVTCNETGETASDSVRIEVGVRPGEPIEPPPVWKEKAP